MRYDGGLSNDVIDAGVSRVLTAADLPGPNNFNSSPIVRLKIHSF
jgi:hypothetical protein